MLAEIPPFFYYLIVYTVYLLLPILPAIIIYKIAPNAPISATGTLNNVTFKAGGAFAAYIIVVLLGYFIIQSAQVQIEKLIDQKLIDQKPDVTWKIKANIKFKDFETGKELDRIQAVSFLKSLQVYIKPKLTDFTSNILSANIPESFINKEDATILFTIDQSEVVLDNDPIVLNKTNPQNFDHPNKIIDLHDVMLNVRKIAPPPSKDSLKGVVILQHFASPPPVNAGVMPSVNTHT